MTELLGTNLTWQSIVHPSVPNLEADELHLWWLPLSLSEQQQGDALTLLSDIQRDRYLRRRAGDAQEAYLAGRYYLLNLLAAYTTTTPNAVQLSYSSMNKPSLSHKEHDLHFNFTDTQHQSQRHGLFAFCRRREVGVDIESYARKNNFAAIAADRFTNAEQQFVTRNGDVDARRFLAIWTRKEAFGKATGKGINFKMNEQDLSNGDAQALNFFDPQNRAWRLQQFALGDDLISAVVHAGHTPLRIRAFNQIRDL
ncbi:hypothetical protein GCM10008090_10660 [Arenicella chitinivorans]|uniref:4'-phosphopantetheinyl transferase domain-containing protein n=1 Tax=Arenicella chitinivorans TaxID=1329800 RepID=A0A918RNV2_9GAMM|nr:4'-phosphopantetheinyl transferase superfamily protein [Arenicella chitinivorans]GHA03443.1 hypothetical protein GCM10008090_10660 [Arenicella chitinivorans]